MNHQPDARPRAEVRVPRPDGAELYVEEWGTPGGVPALYLHGGPGGTLGRSSYRTKFDLTRTRLIGLDQRGCGRSTPHAADPATTLDTQTIAHLIADLEAVREHLGVQAWLLSGVSWGSTLAIAYAQAHPQRVLGVVLMAVTTTARREVDWITEGVARVFPEAWDRLAAHAEAAGIGYRRGQGRLVEAYAALMNHPDADVRDAASWEWARWEDTHIALGAGGLGEGGQPHADPRWQDEAFRLAMVRLTTHHWAHDAFCDPPLLERMDRLAGVPAVLIHGRADVSGPVETAWRVHRAWPGSRLVIDESEGHGGAAMVQQWRRATTEMAERLMMHDQSCSPCQEGAVASGTPATGRTSTRPAHSESESV